MNRQIDRHQEQIDQHFKDLLGKADRVALYALMLVVLWLSVVFFAPCGVGA